MSSQDGIPSFEEAVSSTKQSDGSWSWTTHESWLQGRTVFGGLTVAAVAKALTADVLSEVPEDNEAPQLRTIQYVFPAPLLPGAAQIETSVDRRGKSATFASAAVVQEGNIIGRANAVFGVGRESKIVKRPSVSPLDVDFEASTKIPYLEGVTPVFTNQFDLHWAVKEFPFTGSQEGIVGGYCRHNTNASGPEAVLALLDAWPPSVLPIMNAPAAASSVALTMHIVADDTEFGPEDLFEFCYETRSASNGYATEIGELVLRGEVIAWVEQLVAVFDQK